jgi:hypothetical protein
MNNRPTLETDAAEAKRRAEWLHKHKAHKDWIILSVLEVAVIRDELLILEQERNEARESIERQKLEIVRLNGATNHAGGTPLKIALRERDEWAAMCGQYKQERDEAITRRMETIMQCELYEQERDEARDALREIWQSGDAFLPHVDKETTTRWRKAAGWGEAK